MVGVLIDHREDSDAVDLVAEFYGDHATLDFGVASLAFRAAGIRKRSRLHAHRSSNVRLPGCDFLPGDRSFWT